MILIFTTTFSLYLLVFRQLQKQRLKHSNAIVIRDSLRNEVAKQQRIEEEMREKRGQHKMDIDKLNLLINQAEEQMVQLRKRYETAVQNRNDRYDITDYKLSQSMANVICLLITSLGEIPYLGQIDHLT